MTTTSETSFDRCIVCGHDELTAGGFDGDGNPITVCPKCGQRQEEE